VATDVDDRRALEELDVRIKTMLPEEYQDSYDDVQPVSMGSAGLKYDNDGKVAWNEIWGSFCDLAMAGGPPHKGMLLEPAAPAEITVATDRYGEVTAEICRGVEMVTELPADVSPVPGWVQVECLSAPMAGWLARAIVMENVSARCDGTWLSLPAGPSFRLEKEIKNVVTVIAKTCHYWLGHMPRTQQRAIATLFAKLAAEDTPLVAPAVSHEVATSPSHQAFLGSLGDAIARQTGLRASAHRYAGWLGVEVGDVRAAIWMMRAMVVSNVLSRREGTVLFLPVDPVRDPTGGVVASTLARVRTLAVVAGVL
jgi:sirohydrochlorin cobaltochelatase